MQYIVLIAPDWNYTEGGINSFNFDFAKALGLATESSLYRVVCISLKPAKDELVQIALNHHVKIISVDSGQLDPVSVYKTILEEMEQFEEAEYIFYVGHDSFTGRLANQLKSKYGKTSCSIVFHHMDYESYYTIKGDVPPADIEAKLKLQNEVLCDSDFIVGIGPKLKDSALERTGHKNKSVYVLVPGLAPEAEPNSHIHTISAIAFGRYDVRNDRLKQMLLAARAFVMFVRTLDEEKKKDATLKILGISDPEESKYFINAATEGTPEFRNVLPLPYSTNREELFQHLSASGVCLMLSVHEGFGLVGWEAIASGVPLIVSKNTGLFQFIREFLGDRDPMDFGILGVDIMGSMDGKLNGQDLAVVQEAFKDFFEGYDRYKAGILSLRTQFLEKYQWKDAAQTFMEILKIGRASLVEEQETIGDKLDSMYSLARQLNAEGNFQPLLHTDIGETASPLTYRSRSIPFEGREMEMEALDGFTRSEDRFAWCVVIGEGGSGKSRMALEHLIVLATSGEWYAGFLQTEAINGFDWGNWRPFLNTFIVIDYASRDISNIIRVVENLNRLVNYTKKKIRVVLIDRHAEGEWWRQLDTSLKMGRTAPLFFEDPLKLPSLRSGTVRRLIGHYIRSNDMGITISEAYEAISQHAKHDLPLYTIVLLSNLENVRGIVRAGGGAFSIYVSRENQEIWNKIFPDETQRRKHKALIAYLTISGGAKITEIKTLMGDWPFFPSALNVDIFGALDLYRTGDTFVSAIEPHLLGEEFIWANYFDNPPFGDFEEISGIFKLAWEQKPDGVKNFVLRFISDYQLDDTGIILPIPNEDSSQKYIGTWCTLQADFLAKRIAMHGCADAKVGEVYGLVKELASKDPNHRNGRFVILIAIISSAGQNGLTAHIQFYNDELTDIIFEDGNQEDIYEAATLYNYLCKYTMRELDMVASSYYMEKLQGLSTIDKSIRSGHLLGKITKDLAYYTMARIEIEKAKEYSISHPVHVTAVNRKRYIAEADKIAIKIWLSLRGDNLDEAILYLDRIELILNTLQAGPVYKAYENGSQKIITYIVENNLNVPDTIGRYADFALRHPSELGNGYLGYWADMFPDLLRTRYKLATDQLAVLDEVVSKEGLNPYGYGSYWTCILEHQKHWLRNYDLTKAVQCFEKIHGMFTLPQEKQDRTIAWEGALYLSIYCNEDRLPQEDRYYYNLAEKLAGSDTIAFTITKGLIEQEDITANDIF